MVTVKKYCAGHKTITSALQKEARHEMVCAAQTCLSQARPQMRAYSFGKARQQAGEFSSFGAADQGP